MITTELRWFYLGTPPETVCDWFLTADLGPIVGFSEARVERYLCLASADYLNLKLRSGNLEVKLRQKQLGMLHVRDRWVGQVEQWVKWECSDLSELSELGHDTEGDWINVTKKRSQRQYQTSSAQPLVSVPLDQDIQQGCRVELTQLTVLNRNWWSIALEAFGPVADQVTSLQKVANYIEAAEGSPVLEDARSYAYPHWLADLVRG